MEPSITYNSLSALTPVKFTYKFNKEEKLSKEFVNYSDGFSYYKHNALSGIQDAVFSKKNLLLLTNNIPLKEVFDIDSSKVDIGTIAGSFFLKNDSNIYVTSLKNGVFLGGAGEKLLITVVPISNNIVELIVDKTRKLTIDSSYPYTLRISDDQLNDANLYRQKFEMDYKEGLVCFKVNTNEGSRYLSYGADQVVRAIGVTLNETIVNQYLFKVEFATSNGIYYGFDATVSEVKYFNELGTFLNQTNLNIKEEQISDTHLLMSCSTSLIAMSAEVPINIALTKTNFSASGSYLTKQTI